MDAFGNGRPDLAFPEDLARHLHTSDLAAAAIADGVSAVVFKLNRIAHDGRRPHHRPTGNQAKLQVRSPFRRAAPISFLALGQSITAVIGQTIGKLHVSIDVGQAAGSGARPFGSQALAIAAATPGVTGAQPVETSSVQYNGQAYAAWGLGPRPLYAYRLSAGRWFTAADGGATGIPPVILGPVVADTSGARPTPSSRSTPAAGGRSRPGGISRTSRQR